MKNISQKKTFFNSDLIIHYVSVISMITVFEDYYLPDILEDNLNNRLLELFIPIQGKL